MGQSPLPWRPPGVDGPRAELAASGEDSARTSRLVVALALLLGVAATAVNLVLIQRMPRATFRPLRHLIDGVRRFSADDLTHRIEPLGDREFRAVSESFNAMAERHRASGRRLLRSACAGDPRRPRRAP